MGQIIIQTIKENYLHIILVVSIIIFIFLVIREIATWYWKINDRISILERIETSLIKVEEGITFLAAKEGFSLGESDQSNTNVEVINNLATTQGEIKKNG